MGIVKENNYEQLQYTSFTANDVTSFNYKEPRWATRLSRHDRYPPCDAQPGSCVFLATLPRQTSHRHLTAMQSSPSTEKSPTFDSRAAP